MTSDFLSMLKLQEHFSYLEHGCLQDSLNRNYFNVFKKLDIFTMRVVTKMSTIEKLYHKGLNF